MNVALLKKLIDRKIVVPTTEIDAFYTGRDISGIENIRTMGTFVIVEIKETDDGYTFDTRSIVDGSPRRLSGKSVVRIDGMEPSRLAEVHNLSPEGEPIPQGKRRGRKPKVRIVENVE